MSKLKDISSSVDSKGMQRASDPQAVTAVEDVDMFNTVMDVADSALMEQERQEQQHSSNEDKEAEAAKEVKSAKEAKEAGKNKEAKKADDDDHKLSEEEQKEIEEHNVNVGELARQLNVLLDTNPEQTNEVAALETAKEGADLGNIPVMNEEITEVDPELIKKIDVKTLQSKLEAAMEQNRPHDSLDVDVPEEMAQQTDDLAQEIPEINMAEIMAQIEESDADQNPIIDLTQKVDNKVALEKMPTIKQEFRAQEVDMKDARELIQDGVKEVIQEQVQDTAVEAVEEGVELILNVVAAYVEPASAKVMANDTRQMVEIIRMYDENFNPMPETAAAPEVLESLEFNVDGLVSDLDITNVQDVVPLAAPVSITAGSEVPKAFFEKSFLSPMYRKVGEVVLNMARDGKSGTTRIEIHPPELGSVNIKFQVEGDKVHAEIITKQQATKELLDSYMPHLRDIITSENLSIESFSLKQDSSAFDKDSDQGQNTGRFIAQDQQAESQQQKEHRGWGSDFARQQHYERLEQLIAKRRQEAADRLKINF